MNATLLYDVIFLLASLGVLFLSIDRLGIRTIFKKDGDFIALVVFVIVIFSIIKGLYMLNLDMQYL